MGAGKEEAVKGEGGGESYTWEQGWISGSSSKHWDSKEEGTKMTADGAKLGQDRSVGIGVGIQEMRAEM